MVSADAKHQDIHTFDRSQATNIADIKIDDGKELKKRILDYVEQVRNPYFLTVGDVLVQMDYADTPYSFNDRYKRIVVNASA